MECSDGVGALDSRGARSRLEDRLSLTVAEMDNLKAENTRIWDLPR